MRFITPDNLIHALSAYKAKLDSMYAAKNHGTHLTLGTTNSTAYRGDLGNAAYNHSQAAHAPSNAQKNSDITKSEIEAKLTGAITSHTHSYAGSSSAGGAATSANKVNANLAIKFNGGTTEGTNLFTFNGSSAKTVNITPSSIGAAASSHGTHLELGTTSSTAAAGNHTHKYAGSSSAGGAATSANKVNTNLIIKLNGGSTEGTDLFTFNGSAAKTVNITPSAIGAAASSHGTHLTIGTSASTAAAGNHTHNYAGSSSAGGAATSVKTNLTIKLNSGSTEGTNLFTFNGSTAKTINITPSAIGAAASSHGTHLTIGTGSGNAAAGNHSHTLFTRSSVGDIGWSTNSNQGLPVSVSAIAYWNGAYQNTTSNLTYCKHGAFGTIVTKNAGDYAAASHGTHLTIGTGSGNAAAGNHTHSYLPLSGGTVSGRINTASLNVSDKIIGETCFSPSGSWDDPWTGVGCAIKANGHIATTEMVKASYVYSHWMSTFGGIRITNGATDKGGHILSTNNTSTSTEYWAHFKNANGTVAYTSDISDRTQKENIVYVNKENSEVTYEEMYDFVKNDLELATYNLKDPSEYEKHTKINFIAQDILCNEDQTENKIGNIIVIAQKCMEDQGVLQYDTSNYVSIIAGALKEAINEIELLKSKNEELIERLLKIELNEGGK